MHSIYIPNVLIAINHQMLHPELKMTQLKKLILNLKNLIQINSVIYHGVGKQRPKVYKQVDVLKQKADQQYHQ